jgi:hypothetical protein
MAASSLITGPRRWLSSPIAMAALNVLPPATTL